MKNLNILHISDLHFMNEEHCNRNKDDNPKSQKDSQIISNNLLKELTYKDPKDCFYQNIFGLFENEIFDLIACTGDLGYKNDPKTIKKGASYIGKLAERLNVSRKHVIISPGNHDLNREAVNGKEFEVFINVCSEEKFTFPNIKSPASIEINGIPIIALNSCLGGTEKALLGGFPDEYWDLIKEYITGLIKNNKLTDISELNMPEQLKFQTEYLDIPAFGRTQLQSLCEFLIDSKSNFSIILCHHNPVPTYFTQIIPYPDIIDAGPFIYRLLNRKKRSIILHGHTHCDGNLTIYEEGQKEHKFLTAIGCKGLYDPRSAGVTGIKILIDSNNNFLAGVITKYIKEGEIFKSMPKYYILDSGSSEIQSEYSLENIKVNTQYQFSQIASILGKEANEKTAEDLIRFSGRIQINILNLDQPSEKWIINRIG